MHFGNAADVISRVGRKKGEARSSSRGDAEIDPQQRGLEIRLIEPAWDTLGSANPRRHLVKGRRLPGRAWCGAAPNRDGIQRAKDADRHRIPAGLRRRLREHLVWGSGAVRQTGEGDLGVVQTGRGDAVMEVGEAKGATVIDTALRAIEGKVLQQSGAYIIDEAGSKVAYMTEAPALSEAHKRRIVAAVNACAGISLEELRAIGVGGLATLLERVRGGGREEGREAVQVFEDGAVQVECGEGQGQGRETTVHVIAWQYAGGAGFHWYEDKLEADEAFADEQRLCAQMQDRLWKSCRFEVEVDALLMKDEITALIRGQLDALCALQDAGRSREAASQKVVAVEAAGLDG